MLECFPVITNQRFQIENAILIKVKESPVAESDYHDSRPYLGHLCSSYWLKPSLTEIVSLVWPSPPTTEMTGKIYSQEKNKDSTLMVGFSCVVLKLPAQRGLWLSERVSLLPALVIMVAVNPQPGLHLSLGGEVRSHHNTVHQPLICPAVCRPQLGQVVVEVLTDALCDLPRNETILMPSLHCRADQDVHLNSSLVTSFEYVVLAGGLEGCGWSKTFLLGDVCGVDAGEDWRDSSLTSLITDSLCRSLSSSAGKI